MTNQTLTRTGTRQWSIDQSHSEVGFSVRHLMIATVRGRFDSVTGSATFDPENIESGAIEVEIDAASVNTRESTRDGHLRSADFFDVENYPTIRFESRLVEHSRGNRYRIDGMLTIRNVTRPVTLEAEFTDAIADPFGGTRVGVTAGAEIDRTEFGLTYNQALETGGVLVGEKVKITIEAELVTE